MSKFPFDKPSRLYNAMMNPLIHMSIKGMVWYQGEDNRVNPGDYKTDDGYACFFPKMIEDYRSKFSKNSDTDPKFPFGFVQLTGYCGTTNHTCDGSDENLGFIRMAQTAGYGYAPNPAMENTFMATTYIYIIIIIKLELIYQIQLILNHHLVIYIQELN